MDGDDDKYFYALPLETGNVIRKFDLSIRVANQDVVLKGFLNTLKKLMFSNEKGYRVIKYTDKKFKADKTLEFEIPKYKNNDYAVFTGDYEGETYFYVTMKVPELDDNRKKVPESVAVFWDVSNSGYRRNLSEELTFLREYLKMLPSETKVSVSGFSNEVNYYKEFDNLNSVQEILEYIKTFCYDGGTNLNKLILPDNYDEILLFTDGINTIGEETVLESSKPVYTVASAAGSNYSMLNKTAEASDGEFLNLTRFGIVYCLKKLTTVRRKNLSYNINIGDVYSIYPKIKTTVDKHFEFSGILSSDEAEIEVDFGISGNEKVTRTIKIKAEGNVPVHRIWATKKMHQLERDYDSNKDEILSLGREHTIVTRNTSLLVLENGWDYRKYGILPPPELLTSYNKHYYETKEENKNKQDVISQRNIEMLRKQLRWYLKSEDTGKDYALSNNTGEDDSKRDLMKNKGSAYLSGTVRDKSNDVIAGVVVLVKADGILCGSALTKENGSYSIYGLNPGVYDVEFKRTGFASIKLTHVVVSGSGNYLDAELEVKTLRGNTIVLHASKPRAAVSRNKGSRKTKTTTKLELNGISYIDGLLSPSVIGPGYEPYDASKDARRINDLLQGKTKVMFSFPEGNENTQSGVATIVYNNDQGMVSYKIDVENLEKIDFSSDNLCFSNNYENILKSIKDEYSKKRFLGILDSKMQLVSWNQDSVYVNRMVNAEADSLEKLYFSFKQNNMNNPFFYYNCYMIFNEKGFSNVAQRILTNMVEIELENAELMRIVARQLLSVKDYGGAIALFNEVRILRPEEPQSFRDLALACQKAGEYQRALNLFVYILDNIWDGNEDFKSIVLNEMNNLLYLHNDQIDMTGINPVYINYMPLDIRIVLEWSQKDADIDLIVIEPGDEKCCFSNRFTKSWGKLTSDSANDYGPEEYTIRKAPKGMFRIKVRNFITKNHVPKSALIGYATIYTKYSTNEQTEEKITFELDESGELIMLGTVKI